MRSAEILIAIAGVNGALAWGSQLPVKIYTTADGLANNRINKIVRDSRGYLWFCTQEGLSRFDGYGFTNYGPQQGLPPRSVNDLLETRTGEYWLATNDGLVLFDPESVDHKFRLFLPGDGEESQRIYTVVEDHAGVLWLGTDGGLYRFDRIEDIDLRTPVGRFRRVEIGWRGERAGDDHVHPPSKDRRRPVVNVLLEDRRSTLWIGTESGLYHLLANGAAERFTTGRDVRSNFINVLLEDHLGRLWAGTIGGLYRISQEHADGRDRVVERIYRSRDGLADDWVMSLFESQAGKLWVGTSYGLSELLPEPLEKSRPLKRYTMANGLSSHENFSIAEDRNANLWIGGDNGAIKITQSNFTTFTAADGLPAAAYAPSSVIITSIFEDRSGALLVTTGRDHRKPFLSRLEGDQFKSIFPNLPIKVALGWGLNQVALQDHAGDWWIATAMGLARFANPVSFDQLAHAPLKAFYTTIDGLQTNEVFRIFEDSHGDIWAATVYYGLTRWDRRTALFERVGDPLVRHRFISALAEDHAGNLWIGIYDKDLVRFRSGKCTRFSEADGLGAGGVRDIYCDRAGRMWIGTSRGGVTRVDSPESDHPRFTSIGVSEGLSSMRAECITEDRWGRIYVCGGRGIDRLDPVAPNGARLTKHFTTADGLAGGNLQAAFADRDGNLWFGTTLGLSRLVPEPDPPQTPPRILITGLRIRGVPYPLSDLGVEHLSGVQLKPDQTQIDISFLGLSFEAGEVLRYQFMLADADRDWSPPTAQRSVNYASLRPGSYRFMVRAVNSAGIGGSAPASIAFTILPPLWQRWWFLALCAGALMSLLYALHRDRVGRVVQLERIRTKIATDLHDDIGASLSQIAVVSEVLSRRGDPQGQFREPLSQIANDSRELVASMSDLVWSIDPRRDQLHDLIQRMRRFASDMFTARNIQFRFSAPVGDLHLSVDQRRHIFLIFKEGVNNIVRHSDCTEAEVGLTFETSILVLRVRDNGRGIDLSQANRGNGLTGMRARAEALGGEVEIGSGPDCGTDVTLKVPVGRLPTRRWRVFSPLRRW
jgi:ligand-binding sensor domain-containing protein/signal transduction histidine kinase